MHGLPAFLGSLLGFLAASVPVLVQLWQDRANHKRDLEAKQQQIDAAKEGYEFAVAHPETDLAAGTAEQMAIMAADARELKGHPALQFLKSSVRPTLTYAFFLLFATVKLTALFHGLHVDKTPAMQMLPQVWDEDCESLFAAVISFWFGSRVVANAKTMQKPKVRITDALKGHNSGGAIVGG